MKEIISTNKLTKQYKISSDNEVIALNCVDFSVDRGSMVAITGPSGSGKSTLLNLIGVLDKPSSGSIIIDGVDTRKIKNSGLARIRSEKIGFIFQSYNLINNLTALDNVALPLIYKGKSKKFSRKKAKELLDLVGLERRVNHYPNQLSGGQQQRVAIARALVNDPAIILADEPTGNLDSKNGIEIIELMQRLNKEKQQTFIIVTHNPDIATICDKIIELKDGRVVS